MNFFDQKEIEKLRIMGIDGILICVYLLNQSSLTTSIRTIHKTLQIPLSTVYRTIQRLEEKEMVISHYTTESPGKKYYKIAPEGESSILLLYELLGETEIPIFNQTKIKGNQTS
jgi:DNA-binding PadR family transcriptional regulator